MSTPSILPGLPALPAMPAQPALNTQAATELPDGAVSSFVDQLKAALGMLARPQARATGSLPPTPGDASEPEADSHADTDVPSTADNQAELPQLLASLGMLPQQLPATPAQPVAVDGSAAAGLPPPTGATTGQPGAPTLLPADATRAGRHTSLPAARGSATEPEASPGAIDPSRADQVAAGPSATDPTQPGPAAMSLSAIDLTSANAVSTDARAGDASLAEPSPARPTPLQAAAAGGSAPGPSTDPNQPTPPTQLAPAASPTPPTQPAPAELQPRDPISTAPTPATAAVGPRRDVRPTRSSALLAAGEREVDTSTDTSTNPSGPVTSGVALPPMATPNQPGPDQGRDEARQERDQGRAEVAADKPASVEAADQTAPAAALASANPTAVAPADAPRPSEVVAQIAQQSELYRLPGGRGVRIQLHPEGLGGVQVTVRYGGAGSVELHLSVEHAATANLVQAGWGELRDALVQQGISPDRLVMSISGPENASSGSGAGSSNGGYRPDGGPMGFGQSTSQQGQQDRPERPGGRWSAAPENTPTEELAEAAPASMSRLDLRV